MDNYEYEESEPLVKPYHNSGVVNAFYRGRQIDSGRDVLVSEFKDTRFERLNLKYRRLQKLKSARHHHLSEIIDVLISKEKGSLYVILEWCEGGTLYAYQQAENFFDAQVVTKIIRAMASGLKALHDQGLFHRNINMENVEFDRQGNVKLSFKCLYPKVMYLSPEEKQGAKAKENDIFSMGVLAYKLLLKAAPFRGSDSEIEEQVKAGVVFPQLQEEMFPIAVPSALKSLISSMLSFGPEERPSCDKVIEVCGEQEGQLKLSGPIKAKVFTPHLIPFLARLDSKEQKIAIALDCKAQTLKKVHILKASKVQISDYRANTLEKFISVQDIAGVVPILHQEVIENEYLVIHSPYDNQGTLLQYLEDGGEISKTHIRPLISDLTSKVKTLGPYNYLTLASIILSRGHFYISYPPIPTQSFMKRLREEPGKMSILAPEVRKGLPSQVADGWSLAALQYLLLQKKIPKTDANGNPLLQRQAIVSLEDRQFYQKYLQVDTNKRHNIHEELIPKKDNIMPEGEGKKEPKPSEGKAVQGEGNAAEGEGKAGKEEEGKAGKEEEGKAEGDLEKGANMKISGKLVGRSQRWEEGKLDRGKIIAGYMTKRENKGLGGKISEKSEVFLRLEKHWTKPLRVGIKCVLGLIMLIFLFYWNFFLINGQLIAEHSLYESKVVLIRAFEQDSTPDVEYDLVTKTPAETYSFFYNETLEVLRDQYHCVLNDYSVGSNVVQVINSSSFSAYQVFGIMLALFNLIIFCVSLSKMDYPKVTLISRFEENDFTVLWNWMFINMALATQISFLYLLYGSLFHLELEPCLQKASLTAVQYLLKRWNFSFAIRFSWIYSGLIFSYLVVGFFILKPSCVTSKFVKAALLCLYLGGVLVRIMGESGDFVAWEKESVFGKVGELLLLIVCVEFLVLDLIFSCKVTAEENEAKGNQVADHSRAEINETEFSLEG